MRKKSRNLKSFLVLLALLAGVVGANFAFANGHNQHTSQAHISGGAKAATARVVSMHIVNMQHVPAETPKSVSHHPTALPFLNSGVGLKTVRLGLVTLVTTSVFQVFEK